MRGTPPPPATRSPLPALTSPPTHTRPQNLNTIISVRSGHVRRVTDEETEAGVLELSAPNVATTYITCPADPSKTLGIKLPFLVLCARACACVCCALSLCAIKTHASPPSPPPPPHN